MPASPIARIPGGTFGPYLGMRGDAGLALWASSEGILRAWFARPISASGIVNGETVRLGEAPNQLGVVAVRPLPGGFALISSHKTSDGEVVEVSLLSNSGALRAGPTSIGRTGHSVLWVEAIPSAHGTSVLWAESGAGRAQIWLAEISAQGELSGSPHVVAKDAGAWQALAFGKDIALAVTHVGKGNTHGPIELSLIDGANAASANIDTLRPITINASITADLDLDMAATKNRLFLAWSDHRGGETRVFSAAIAEHGKLVAEPAPATPPLGEQAALRVVPPADGAERAYLAWESLGAQAANYRSFQVAELHDDGRVSSPRGLFEYWKMDGSVPELAATHDGVAVLTLAPLCKRNATCDAHASIAPEFVTFDANFAVKESEPLWATGANAPVSLAWNLNCPNRSCFALSAESGAPAHVALMQLERVSDEYRAPAERVELPPPPRIMSDEALAETAPLSQLALSDTNAGTLLAWLTDFDPTTPWVKLKKPTADGRYEPLRAELELQGFANGEHFAALGAPEPLSLRAHSLGGIALSGGSQKAGTLAVWSGLDGGQPQVFLTLVDKLGKKLSQRMLTHKNGDLSDVAVTQLGSDYLVAWVDERSGDPELYATKVNHALARVAPEQRLTQAPGSATDTSLVPTKNGALLVWADARESELPGSADIYSAALRGSDAARTSNEVCIQKSRSHSFAPVARAYEGGALVAWLEAAVDAPAEPPHLRFARLDEMGRVLGSVQSVDIAGTTPITLDLECSAADCHAIVAGDEGGRGALYAVSWRDGKAGNPVRIRSTNNAPTSVAPVIHGRDVYVSDVQLGRAHVRRLQLEW